jgi:hypothetical protein
LEARSSHVAVWDKAKVGVRGGELGGDVSVVDVAVVPNASVVRSWERESVVLTSRRRAARVCRANVVVIAVGRVVCMDAPQAGWVRVRPGGVAVAVVAKVSVAAVWNVDPSTEGNEVSCCPRVSLSNGLAEGVKARSESA